MPGGPGLSPTLFSFRSRTVSRGSCALELPSRRWRSATSAGFRGPCWGGCWGRLRM